MKNLKLSKDDGDKKNCCFFLWKFDWKFAYFIYLQRLLLWKLQMRSQRGIPGLRIFKVKPVKQLLYIFLLRQLQNSFWSISKNSHTKDLFSWTKILHFKVFCPLLLQLVNFCHTRSQNYTHHISRLLPLCMQVLQQIFKRAII